MISTFYGEGSPISAADSAQSQFRAWQQEHDVEILAIATATCPCSSERVGFWLTIHWRWNEDAQRWSDGDTITLRAAHAAPPQHLPAPNACIIPTPHIRE
jgi:hypothetical protein